MCGRYYIDLSDPEFFKIAERFLDEKDSIPVKLDGEIFPSDTVPVRTAPEIYLPMSWGFTSFNKRLVINARSETALEKPMFKEAMLERRCLIPASGYYEWETIDGKKQRYAFYEENALLFLAGCYRKEKDEDLFRFVILTRDASDHFRYVHDRMPVIIPRSKTEDWLLEGPDAMEDAFTDPMFHKVRGS